jgi:hypothetical protein
VLVVPSAFLYTVVSSWVRPPDQLGLSVSVWETSWEQAAKLRSEIRIAINVGFRKVLFFTVYSSFIESENFRQAREA